MSEANKPSKANEIQVGGDHYQTKIQHWDYVWANNLDYFQAQVTRYIGRWKKKDGMKDVYKARHTLDKYIELLEAGGEMPVTEMVELNVGPDKQPEQPIWEKNAAEYHKRQTSNVPPGPTDGSYDPDTVE